MEDHKAALIKYLPLLQDTLDLSSKLWGLLRSHEVLTYSDVQNIKGLGRSDEDQVLQLVQILEQKSRDCFTKFLAAISETGQRHLVEVLEGFEENMVERTLERQALGRAVELGMIYDCRNDTLIPGITLWDGSMIRKDRDVISQAGTRQFSIIPSDDMDAKSSALNMGTSLTTSFLSGLVEVAGSAEYINDKKTSAYQIRQTVKVMVTTRSEQLCMTRLGRHNVQHQYTFGQDIGTHVVTRVLYGVQAFFIFDRYLSGEDEHTVKKCMTMMLQKICRLNTAGKGEFNLTEKEKEDMEKTQCTFYGDFVLDNCPTKLPDAASIFVNLSSILSIKEQAVPLTVWLYPLSNMDPRAGTVIREIKADLCKQVEDILSDLDNFEIKCDDLKCASICGDFSNFAERLDLGKTMIKKFKHIFKQKLAHNLPKVRAGKEMEETISDLLSGTKQSPFNPNSLGIWTECVEKEMKIVKSYMKDFSSFKMIRSRKELEDLVTDRTYNYLVGFSFPFTKHGDDYLNEMIGYCKSPAPGSYPVPKGLIHDSVASKKLRFTAEHFIDFANANSTSTDTLFAVISFDVCHINAGDAGFVFLYECGVLTTETFTPPSVPVKPKISEIYHDAVTIEWAKLESGSDSANIQYHLVYYRETTTNRKTWSELKTNDARRKATITSLKPNTPYEFSVSAVSTVGVGKASVTSDVNKTLAASPPSGLKKYKVSKTSITVTWIEPSTMAEGVSVEKYMIQYKLVADDKLGEHTIMNTSEEPTCIYTIEGLKSDRKYRIWVSADCGHDGSSVSCNPLDICTDSEKTIASELTNHAAVIECGFPSIYQLPLSTSKHKSGGAYPHYHFGEQVFEIKRHIVLMLVGATGAGKTTLINGMINYILKVDWNDPFRFKIISDHDENPSGGQAESQTQLINSYTIHHQRGLNVSSTLTIIDTPSIGDTRGIEKDKIIIDQIIEFFSQSALHHIDHIDAIGFVVQASQARLTPSQMYVFGSILAIFGNDIAQNIILLITFADGQKPPVMDAIKAASIPCGTTFFKFNNSPLFANNKVSQRKPENCDDSNDESESDDYFDKMFWQMGVQSMKKFFFALDKVTPISLTLTREVLEEPKRLEVAVEALQPQIQMGCCKLKELRKVQEILEQHESEIEANKNFKYHVGVPKSRKIEIGGEFITNCSKCHFTCHYPCSLADDRDKAGCAAMEDGTCTVCPGKCVWNVHFNQSYKFDYYEEIETRTYAELEEMYKDATGRKLTVGQVIEKHQEEFLSVKRCVFELITQSHESLKRLEEIALRPNPLSTVEYVELLIQAEKQEAKPGWKARVKHLQDVRREADILGKIKQANYNLFQSYKKEFHGKQKENKDKAWYKFW